HLVGALVGLTNGFAPLINWRGVSGLLSGTSAELTSNLLSCALAWCTLATLGWATVTRWRGAQRTWVARAAIVNLCAIFLFAAFWQAAYIKIWLFALPAFYF